jgi:microcystin-dependent protein
MLQFFYTPFADSGTKTAIPVAAQVDGSVSYAEGYPLGYQQDPDVDPLTAKDIERGKFNQALYAVTTALKELQSHAIPDFITSSLNGGSPWEYSKYDLVRWFNGVETLVYESLADANDTLPSDTTKWRQFNTSPFPVGSILEYEGATLPSGWLWANGLTIGNASSGGTARANADCETYFTQIWNSFSNTVRPLYTSAGAPVARGASAAADWAANRRITIADRRGTVAAGKDDMGGAAAAGRLTSVNGTPFGSNLGAIDGEQAHTLITAETPVHAHDSGSLAAASNGAHTHTVGTNSGSGGTIPNTVPGNGGSTPGTGVTTSSAGAHTHTISGNTGSSGSGSSHNNVQPSNVANFIVKY